MAKITERRQKWKEHLLRIEASRFPKATQQGKEKAFESQKGIQKHGVKKIYGNMKPMRRTPGYSKWVKKKSLVTDVIDATLGARGLWLGTRTGAGGTAILA